MNDPMRDRIRSRLAELGMSERSASELAGGSASMLRHYLAGRTRQLGADHLKGLARALNTSIEWLMYGSGSSVSPAGAPARTREAGVPEVDVRLGAGGGGIPAPLLDGNGDVADSEAVVQRWGIPDEYVYRDLRTAPARLRIASVIGDSMTPTLRPHDKVMIDTGHNVPSPDGIYALWDGYGVVVKRVEIVPRSDPKRVKVISDNPAHSAYELADGEVAIIGRVVAVIRAL